MLTKQEKNKSNLSQRGITLVVLVVTIIVLLILAGVALATLTGDSGILNNTEKALVESEISEIEEQARLIYMENKTQMKDASMEDIVNELNRKGYQIKNGEASNQISDMMLESNRISISLNGSAKINVKYEENSENNVYFAIIKGKNYKILKDEKGIYLERIPTEIGKKVTLEANIKSGDNIVIEEINQHEISLKANDNIGTSVITVKYGNIEKNCTVAVVKTPTEESVADSENTAFSTNYGTIDVIWLEGTSNVVSTKPNEPNLYTNLENAKLTPVTWTYVEGTDGEEGTWKENNEINGTWYNYKSGNGINDNNSSMWANAKNKTDAGDSYFVWIPRYAYRITYYSDANYKNVTGFYDGWGMWKAEDGTVKYELEQGIETVTHNGNKYIVHPAFMNDTNKTKKDEAGETVMLADYDRGGWNKNLSGFWVAKYEMSRKEADIENEGEGFTTTFKSVPSVRSATKIISNMYTVSLGYDENKESHLMKNSEWGAVAYLTHSQYGRDGYEIDRNNNTNCVTGSGGVKSSSTGNIYGIYDLSGGAFELVAGYNKLGQNYYLTSSSGFGADMVASSKDVNGNYISTKYVTTYNNESAAYNVTETLYLVGKVGDATKEVRGTNNLNWFSDISIYVTVNRPFFARGNSGVFASNYYDGNFNSYTSFRVVLAE